MEDCSGISCFMISGIGTIKAFLLLYYATAWATVGGWGGGGGGGGGWIWCPVTPYMNLKRMFSVI